MKIFIFPWSWRSWDALSPVESASSLMTGFTVHFFSSTFILVVSSYNQEIYTHWQLQFNHLPREISSYQIFQVGFQIVIFISIWSLRPTSVAVRNSGYSVSGKNIRSIWWGQGRRSVLSWQSAFFSSLKCRSSLTKFLVGTKSFLNTA